MSRALPAVFVSLLAAAALSAQPPAEAGPKEDPAIKAKIGELKKLSRNRKDERVGDVIRLIGELAEAQREGVHEKDEKRMLRALGTVLTKGKLRKPTQYQVYVEACLALEHFGEPACKPLKKAYESKRFPRREDDWALTRAQILKSVGKTRDERAVDFLISVAIRGENPDAGAAGEALGNFEASKQKIRKSICEALITHWEATDVESRRLIRVGPDIPQDFGPANALERLDHIKGPFRDTLEKMSNERFGSPMEWRRWWGSVRRKNWDK